MKPISTVGSINIIIAEMASAKSEMELLVYGFELDVFKRQCAKYARLNCKRMIQSFFSSIVESAQKECTVEMARKIQNLSDNYMQIIKLDLVKLNRTFDEKVDKYFTVPMNVTVHGVSGDRDAAVCDSDAADANENTLNERVDELETVYKQQAILSQRIRAELEFYNTVMDVQAEIDDGLCFLVEKCMQDNATGIDSDERILEQLNNVLEFKNAEIES